jgi:hypothetical protein
VDPAGGLLWAKAFRTSGGDDVLHAGVELPTGGFLLAGGSGTVLNLDPSGGLVWARSYGLAEIREIAPSAGGGFVMAGWRPAGGSDAAELIAIDAAGEILWRGTYGQTGVAYRFFAVAPLPGGGFLAGGEVNGPGFTDFHGWVARLDASGDLVWQRHLNDPGGEVHAVAVAAGGGVLVGGRRQNFPRMMVGRLDGTGQAPGCGHAATSALRIASGAGWTAVPAAAVEPATLVAGDAADAIGDALAPEDQTSCSGGPAYPPSEVSPPAASDSPLVFDDDRSLRWEEGAPSEAGAFHLYRATSPRCGREAVRAASPPVSR